MQPIRLSFHCERLHYFFNSHYTVNIYDDCITLNKVSMYYQEKFNSQKPKYICHLSFENKVHWYTETGEIHAFGLLCKKKIKFFKAAGKILEEMRNLLGGKIIFDQIVSFYKCIRQIGEGPDSKVFKVEDSISKSFWALKCFERKDDFLQEIKIHDSLRHNNIVQFREYFEGEQYHYVVMELLNGLSLQKFFEKGLVATHTQCKMIIQGLLNALLYLKRELIIHRDIKPANIIFQQSGRAETLKIVDFNFAIRKYDTVVKPLPYGIYTAPEAIQDKPDYTEKMDIYSCGAILYRLYCGEDIFSSRFIQTQKLFFQQQNSYSIDYSPLEKNNTPKIAIELIKAMLVLDPTKRVTPEEALRYEYFSSDSLSPIDKRSRFQQRHTNDGLKIGQGTADFEINSTVDAKCAQVRGIQIHHHID